MLYRIGTDTPHWLADDRTGAGAERSGGRWNRSGTAMLYTSTSRALACLETLVHLARTSFPFNRFLIEFEVPAAAWAARVVFEPAAHVGWDAVPHGLVSLEWGTAWARSGTSLLAEVPSALVTEETNVLLNPAHPDMVHVVTRKVRRWTYDPRFFGHAPCRPLGGAASLASAAIAVAGLPNG
ncbi:MAG: RES family NAD+ phosphorylase [Gemmatimonadaceae bacterium]|nr:RES family NAD+ phosphorylase [Gemmatimonadaceae bacterium]